MASKKTESQRLQENTGDWVDQTGTMEIPGEPGGEWIGIYKGFETMEKVGDDGKTRVLMIHALEQDDKTVKRLLGGAFLDYILTGRGKDKSIDECEPNPKFYGKLVKIVFTGSKKLPSGNNVNDFKVFTRS